MFESQNKFSGMPDLISTNRGYGLAIDATAPPRYETASILPARREAVKCLDRMDCRALTLVWSWVRIAISPCSVDLGSRHQSLATGDLQLRHCS
jgi:hypothetical protein